MYLWEQVSKSIADTSVIVCDEIIDIMGMPNTISTNATKNCHSEKVRYKFDCYTLHTVLLVIILLLIITIICYYHAEYGSKQKHWCTNNIKMENN